MDGYQHMSQFLKLLRDKDRGRAYRKYAGISKKHIPCEGTFSNFRARLRQNLYNDIFHVLVGIFHQLEMISFKILAHDGTLYPTWSRYKGCTYFCDQCGSITVQDVIGKVRTRILYRLNNLADNNLGSEIRVKASCPSGRFPEKDKNGKEIKRPKIELFACRLAFADGELSEEQKNTAILFGVEQDLSKQNLCIQTNRSNVSAINFQDGSITVSCPKLPKDTHARIGVRRNPKDPNKKEKILGTISFCQPPLKFSSRSNSPLLLQILQAMLKRGARLSTTKNRCTIIIKQGFGSISLTPSTTSPTITNTSEKRAPSLLLITIEETKTYPKPPCSAGVMIKMGGPLLPVGSFVDLMALTKNTNG